MNRRKFTITSLLGLFGLTISPNLTFADSFRKLNIGFINEHVRHGLLNNENFHEIKELGVFIKRDLFFKNGINKCKNNSDLLIVTISKNNKKIILTETNSEKKIDNYDIKLLENKFQKYEKKLTSNSAIIPIEGTIRVNGSPQLNQNEAILCDGNVIIDGEGKFIHIYSI